MLQSKISRYYIQKLAELILLLIVVTATAYSFFGIERVTDYIHTTIYICLAVYFRHDKNLLTILLIIGLSRLIPQLAIRFDLSQEYVVRKILFYSVSAYICYRLRVDKLAVFALVLIFCMVVAEFYWGFTQYDRAPWIATMPLFW